MDGPFPVLDATHLGCHFSSPGAVSRCHAPWPVPLRLRGGWHLSSLPTPGSRCWPVPGATHFGCYFAPSCRMALLETIRKFVRTSFGWMAHFRPVRKNRQILQDRAGTERAFWEVVCGGLGPTGRRSSQLSEFCGGRPIKRAARRQNQVQSSSRLCLNLLPIGFDAKRVWKMPKTMPYKTAITGFHLRCIACPRLQAVDS